MGLKYFIYIISFLEGFTTLSVEIIAIRVFTPIVGTNSISTSIILGVILLALSYGYYIGGKDSKSLSKDGLKNKIIFNLFVSGTYYLLFTFLFDKFVLEMFLGLTGSYFFGILISSIFLFFLPVFFASQTIPLLSEILEGENSGEKIGKLLFFSTVGSFLGSVLTSTLLFSLIGVFKSSILSSFILLSISFLFAVQTYNSFNRKIILILVFLSISFSLLIHDGFNNSKILFSESNSYHDIEIYDNGNGKRVFSLSKAYSSGIDLKTKESFFNYIKEIKSQILKNNYKDILIIGAAGFTLPYELSKFDNIKNIDVVDVDPSLKGISEKYFLEEKLSDKIKFYPEPSRYFLNNSIKNNKKYDAIVVDVYVGKSLPAQTLTKEFFNSLKFIGGDVYLNIIADQNLISDFSNNLFNTIFNSFGFLYYKDVNNYKSINSNTNFVITNKNIDGYKSYKYNYAYSIYTDDKNSIELDLFKNLNY